MTIEDFLKKFVEGYLFHDLESMAKIELPDGQDDGAAGYPMVSTTLAGVELLGELLIPNTDPFNPTAGNAAFLNFWDNYLSVEYPCYTGLGRLFRQLMRNGVSHTFVAKPGIFVEKGSGRQTSIDTGRQEVFVDCNVFFRELEDVYHKRVKPIVDSTASSPLTTKANMQTRLDNMAAAYSADTNRLFASLPTPSSSVFNVGRRAQVPLSTLPAILSNIDARASGASGTMGPVQTTTNTVSSPVSPFAATATFPSTTVPFVTPSGTLPPTERDPYDK